jgi:hypothetical protein
MYKSQLVKYKPSFDQAAARTHRTASRTKRRAAVFIVGKVYRSDQYS